MTSHNHMNTRDFVRVSEQAMNGEPSYSNLPPRPPTFPRRMQQHGRRWAHRFFPWTTELEQREADFSKRTTFPWLGFAALLCACSTVCFSWLILFLIDNKKEVENKFLKPASWLSALLSLNSVALHIALSEGVTTAWWYTASRKDATFKQLHETWRFGNSLGAVLMSGNKFNYVAMATIFVATVPLNGMLLQNSITMVSFSFTNKTTISVPLPETWPAGYSAQFNKLTGEVGLYNDAFALANYQTFSPYRQKFSYVPFFDSDDLQDQFKKTGCYNRDTHGVCKANVTTVGFDSTCQTHLIPYDLRPSFRGHNFTTRVFDLSVTWDPADPNTIAISVLSKPTADCKGSYRRETCKLRAANVTYPIQIYSSAMEGSGSSYALDYPIIALDSDSTIDWDTIHNLLPVAENEGHDKTTFGGVATALASRYNSNIDWTYTNGSWSVKNVGSFATELPPNTGFISRFSANFSANDAFNPTYHSPDFCRLTYLGQGDSEYTDETGSVIYTIRSDVRQLTFMSSAVQFWKQALNASDSDEPSFYPAHGRKLRAYQTQTLLRYHVRFIYWVASMVITLTIAAMIAPLFYGFWKLNKSASLSPFDTAAAFKAPVLHGQGWETKHTKVLLKEVGKRHVHGASDDWSRPGYGELGGPPQGVVMVTETEMEVRRPQQVRGGEWVRGDQFDFGGAVETKTSERRGSEEWDYTDSRQEFEMGSRQSHAL